MLQFITEAGLSIWNFFATLTIRQQEIAGFVAFYSAAAFALYFWTKGKEFVIAGVAGVLFMMPAIPWFQ